MQKTFTDAMESFLSYAGVFEENYGTPGIDVRIADIVEDMKFSNFLVTNSRESYTHYTSVGKRINKHRGVLSSLAKLCKTASEGRTVRITSFDETSLYISSEKDIILTI